jgi:signal transduction histidine kinase/ActR/RegA family two-component response regulator
MIRPSVSRRLLAITIGVVSLSMILAGGVLVRQHRRELYRSFENGAVVLARAVSEHCVGPLMFDDPPMAMEILAKLESSTVVARAVLYDRQGRFVASYERKGEPAPALPLRPASTLQHLDGYLHVFEPVYHRNIQQGTLYLVASPGDLRARLREGTITIVEVGLAAIVLAALLGGLLQRSITRPILRLAGTMREITTETMHSTRVEHHSRDEIGELYAGFNRMLDQIAARQEERDRSDARLRALIAALPDPVFVLEESGRVLEILAGRDELQALPAAGLAGKTIAEMTAPDQAGRFDEAINRTLASDSPQRLAYELGLASGRRSFDAVLVPITGDHGPRRGGRLVLFVPRDVTERHSLELDLRQAQKMDALGRLAGGVAHDFNNILTAILGYGSLLARRLERDGHSMTEVAEILKAAERAALLTGQLLAFSRRQVVTRRRVSLNDLVGDMQRMLERIIGEDIQLVADLDPQLPPVLGDLGQLQQVLLNLAVNAREAMPSGGTLTLRTRVTAQTTRRAGAPELAPGLYVLLEVNDTGVGMDETVRARIFEPFFTTKGGRGGTGLGLAMVYGIVRQAGGDVSVSSIPRRGSTFGIYLPVALPMAEGVERTTRTLELAEPLPGGNETVLVVEDEPQLRELTCGMLRERGYEVLGAADAQQALQLCSTYHGTIHLMVTDVVMPRMGGGELVRAARPLRPQMKVLYMSGYIDSTVVHHGVAVEQVPFLQKPFTAEELNEKVREALGAGAPQDGPDRSEALPTGAVS